jgi:hypothetical protein
VSDDPRRLARLAAAAAALASAGDLLLLAVANAQRPELGLPSLPVALLWPGAILGVACIPFYALGWRAASRLLGRDAAPAPRIVALAGAASALVGSAIHGLTALEIQRSLASPAANRPPLEAMTDPGSPLLGLWLAAAGLVLVASLAFARAARRAPEARTRRLAALNPALVTVALALAALPFEPLRSFLAPAAPNLAHLLFFWACSRGR